MTRGLIPGILLVAVFAPPASARILKSRLVENTQGRALVLSLGSGIEYESNSEQTELGLPFLVEYGVTPSLTLSAEPKYVSIHPQGGKSLRGVGEIETSASYGLLVNRGRRPAIAATGKIVWPTASHAELGTDHREYSVGVLLGRVFARGEMDVNVSYAVAGGAAGGGRSNAFEASLAAEYDLGGAFDLLGEVVTGGGGGAGDRAHPEQRGRSGEGTIGLDQQVSEHLVLEAGVVFKFDGARQVTLGWEWDFGEN